MYDKIYESAKKRRAGAFIWQLLVEGVDGYTDKTKSCRLQSISAKDKESLNRMILASISCK